MGAWVASIDDNLSLWALGGVGAPSIFAAPGTNAVWADVDGGVFKLQPGGEALATCDVVDGNQWKRDFLLRPLLEAVIDQQVTIGGISFEAGAGVGCALRSQSDLGCYFTLITPTTGPPANSIWCKVVGGTLSTIGEAVTWEYVSGHTYSLIASVVGQNPTTLTYSLTDDATSSVVATQTVADSESSLQVVGRSGVVCFNGIGASAATGFYFSALEVDGQAVLPSASEYIWNPVATYVSQFGGIDREDLTFTVSDASLWTGLLPTRIQIDAEIMLLTHIAGSVFTVTRAVEGSTATVHANNAMVANILSAGALYAVFEAIGG